MMSKTPPPVLSPSQISAAIALPASFVLGLISLIVQLSQTLNTTSIFVMLLGLAIMSTRYLSLTRHLIVPNGWLITYWFGQLIFIVGFIIPFL